jgi:hypothetical protein
MVSGRNNIEQGCKNLRQVAQCALWVLCCAALLFLATGCEKKEPSVDQKFVNTYVEMLVAENIYGKSSTTTMVKRQEILKNAGYTREKFLQKSQAILDDKDMWVPFQKAVIARLDSLIEEGNKSSGDGPRRKRRED